MGPEKQDVARRTAAVFESRESALFPAADRELLHDCVRGTPAAWDAFLERFGGLIAFVIDRTAAQRRVTLPAAVRDDMIADVLLELLQRDAAVLRSFEGRSTLATYVAVLARRVAVRGLRAAARGSDDARDRQAGASQPGAGAAGVDADAMLLQLHDVEGRSYGEIGRILGIPLAEIGPALARARRTRAGSPSG